MEAIDALDARLAPGDESAAMRRRALGEPIETTDTDDGDRAWIGPGGKL